MKNKRNHVFSHRIKFFNVLMHQWFLIVVFLLLISSPLVTHLAGVFDTSYIQVSEKRAPNIFPDLSEIKKSGKLFFNEIELYLNDHFGFRYWLIRANSFIRFKLGVSTSEKVIIGKDGWLFYNDERIIEQYRGLENFKENELNDFLEGTKSRKKWLNDRGIIYLLSIFPEKSTVYPELLPLGINQVGLTRMTQLKHGLSVNDIGFIDVVPGILESKKKLPLYYKSDSHWNHHGGFVAYSEIMKSVRRFYPEIDVLTEKDIDIEYKPSFDQDLARMLNLSGILKDENADYIVRKKKSHVISIEYLGAKERLPFVVRSDRFKAPRVLIIRDSYTDLIEPYLNETFSSILYVYHGKKTGSNDLELNFGPEIQDYVLNFKPDIVIHGMVERVLRFKMLAPVAEDYPVIKDWEPQVFFKDNLAADKKIIIRAGNIEKSAVVEFNGEKLITSVDIEKGTATASIPDRMLKIPGNYRFLLKNVDKKLVSREVEISVKDYKPIAPEIIDWGPKEVIVNKTFNVQTNGISAMWIKASNISKNTVIVWNGYYLQSEANVKEDVVTAYVPDSLFQAPGDYDIFLKNRDDGLVSGQIKILVKTLQ